MRAQDRGDQADRALRPGAGRVPPAAWCLRCRTRRGSPSPARPIRRRPPPRPPQRARRRRRRGAGAGARWSCSGRRRRCRRRSSPRAGRALVARPPGRWRGRRQGRGRCRRSAGAASRPSRAAPNAARRARERTSAQRSRWSSGAADPYPCSYGWPAAAGPRTRPTTPATTTIVTMYGTLLSSCGGMSTPTIGQERLGGSGEPEDECRGQRPNGMPGTEDHRGERDEALAGGDLHAGSRPPLARDRYDPARPQIIPASSRDW